MKSNIIKCTIMACIVLFMAGCSKSSSSYGSSTPPSGSSTSNKVSIANMSFAAAVITVTKGTTVTWTNNDNMMHTVTANDNSFNSGNLTMGGTYSFTFNSSGTFDYHCSIHSGMTGSVIVK